MYTNVHVQCMYMYILYRVYVHVDQSMHCIIVMLKSMKNTRVPGLRENEAAKQEKLMRVYAIRKKLEMTRAIVLRSPTQR